MKRLDPIGRTIERGIAGNYNVKPRACICAGTNIQVARGHADNCTRCSCLCGTTRSAKDAANKVQYDVDWRMAND